MVFHFLEARAGRDNMEEDPVQIQYLQYDWQILEDVKPFLEFE